MHAAVTVLSVLSTVVYVALAALALLQWRRRRVQASRWLAFAFGDLALASTVGRLLPTEPHGFWADLGQRALVVAIAFFPYVLFRFATGFVPPSRRLQVLAAAGVGGLAVWACALPRFPAADEARPVWFTVFLIAFVAEWALLSAVVATRLWLAGGDHPSVARGRMRLTAVAASLLAIALAAVAAERGRYTVTALASEMISILGGVAFLLALAPPAFLRALWRLPEQTQLQEAIRSLMTLATSRAEVAARVLDPAVAILGARGAAVLADDGTLAAKGVEPDEIEKARRGDPNPLVFEAGSARLVVWTSPYAPFFGHEEVGLLETLGALTGITLDRVRLYEREHAMRVALERSNEVMTNFVALAAHELRTPVTTIHGFVQTLNHLGPRLAEDEREQLSTALEQQTTRLASLVEQLLDLSRLDANAIEVRPQVVDLGSRLDEIASVAAAGRDVAVKVDVPDRLDAVVDPAIVERVVTNLVTNAIRYGAPPVRIQAKQLDGSVFIAVEDDGPGVAREVEKSLFERFTRAGVARDRVAGTGLGLAIARAYALAHNGELSYERRWPIGSRFVLRLPAGHG